MRRLLLSAWAVGFLAISSLAGADAVAPPSVVDTTSSPAQSALELAAAGRNEEALQALRAHPAQDPVYFYNLGTLLLKLNQPGLAVAYLEKSVAMNHSDEAARRNLDMARNALSRLIGASQVDPAANWLERTLDQAGTQELWALLSLLALVAVAFWCRAYVRSRRHRLAWREDPSTWMGAGTFTLTLLAMLALARIRSHPGAILLEAQPIRSGPGAAFVELSHAETGTKLRPTGESSAGWLQVRYSRDGIGWVDASKLLPLGAE